MKIFKYTLFIATILIAACGGEETAESLKKKMAENNSKINELRKKNLELDSLIAVKDSTYGTIDTVIVTSKKLKKEAFNKTVEVHGFVESGNNLMVVPEVNGVILDLRVSEGKEVKAGQIIAVIDTKILHSNRAELVAQLDLAKEMFAKQKSLYDQKVGSEVQYLQAKTNLESLEKGIATIDNQISKAYVKAPIGGIVDKIFPRRGEMASMQQPLARIINTKSGAYIESDVSEAYYNKVEAGDTVVIKFPSFSDKEIKARISYKSNYIDNSNRTFKIQVLLDTKGTEYPANLFAIVSLTLESLDGQIVIPTSIIQRHGKTNFVYVVKKSKGAKRAIKRPVQVQMSYDNSSVIKSGLKQGDQIVTKAVWSKLMSIDGEGVIVRTGSSK